MQIDTNGFELGDKVRDPISGVEGVLTAFTIWLTGCPRANINRGVDKDGKPLEGFGCDVTCLELIAPRAVKLNGPPFRNEEAAHSPSTRASTGGPAPNPPSQR